MYRKNVYSHTTSRYSLWHSRSSSAHSHTRLSCLLFLHSCSVFYWVNNFFILFLNFRKQIFGFFKGFNLSLRSSFIYDVVGLECSDDSLFCILLIGPGLGLTTGVPLAGILEFKRFFTCLNINYFYLLGLLYDSYKEFNYVFYFAALALLASCFLTMMGKQLRTFCICSYKSFNKKFLQKNLYF